MVGGALGAHHRRAKAVHAILVHPHPDGFRQGIAKHRPLLGDFFRPLAIVGVVRGLAHVIMVREGAPGGGVGRRTPGGDRRRVRRGDGLEPRKRRRRGTRTRTRRRGVRSRRRVPIRRRNRILVLVLVVVVVRVRGVLRRRRRVRVRGGRAVRGARRGGVQRSSDERAHRAPGSVRRRVSSAAGSTAVVPSVLAHPRGGAGRGGEVGRSAMRVASSRDTSATGGALSAAAASRSDPRSAAAVSARAPPASVAVGRR